MNEAPKLVPEAILPEEDSDGKGADVLKECTLTAVENNQPRSIKRLTAPKSFREFSRLLLFVLANSGSEYRGFKLIYAKCTASTCPKPSPTNIFGVLQRGCIPAINNRTLRNYLGTEQNRNYKITHMRKIRYILLIHGYFDFKPQIRPIIRYHEKYDAILILSYSFLFGTY